MKSLLLCILVADVETLEMTKCKTKPLVNVERVNCAEKLIK